MVAGDQRLVHTPFVPAGYWSPCASLGWIWTINSTDDAVITGSWDGALRVWKLTNSGLAFQSIYQLGTPVLCSSFLDSNTLAVGTHDRNVYLLDIRSFEQNPSNRMCHKNAVLCIDAIYENGLRSAVSRSCTSVKNCISGSGNSCDQICVEYDYHSELSSVTASEENFEDCMIDPFEMESVVLDSSEPSLAKCNSDEISCNKLNIQTNSLPADLNHSPKQSFSNVHLITGSSDQYIAGWDMRNVSQPVHKHKTNQLSGWNRGFGGLKATLGCIFAAGLHGSVEAYHPTNPVKPLSKRPLAEKINAFPTSVCKNLIFYSVFPL
ncbi:unnamed protein product [Schistosoma margrebowiei]|uniref:Uncharacterized protein n=1 Tax=Schistosoma margrebowiei TaxID=48269 RepID=A0A183N9F7_9TREM|nr:unnamed protein product [Schistosoma margrebowiei]